MTKYLCVLAEDDKDMVFYHDLVEMIRGERFELMPFPIERQVGHAKITKFIRPLMRTLKGMGMQNMHCVVAIDNDRRQIHPTHHVLPNPPSQDAGKPCRYCELEQAMKDIWGENWQNDAVQTAFAIPVQMIEAWLIQISNPQEFIKETELPVFGKAEQPLALQYYGNKVPLQLKDLKKAEMIRLNSKGIENETDFHTYCAMHINLNQLATSSPSFRLFQAQVEAWNT